MTSSGASPQLLKKALGQIPLNSPRANQRLVISSHKRKPLFSLTASSVSEPEAIKPPAAAMDDPPSEAVTTGNAMPSSDNVNDKQKTLTVVKETKANARDESTSAAAQLWAQEAGHEAEAAIPIAMDVARGRPSMMVATANPRLQETSALPRGTVVRVRLFAEEDVPEVMQEEKNAHAAELADGKEAEQPDEGGRDVVAEKGPETVQPSHQKQEKSTAVVNACAQGVVSSGSAAVPPEPVVADEQQVETPVPPLEPKAEQGKDGQQHQRGEMAAPVSEESAAAGAAAAMPVIHVQPAVTEGEHALEVEDATDATTPAPDTTVVVVEGHNTSAGMGQAPSSFSRLDMEPALTAVLASAEEEGESYGQPLVSASQQPAEEVVSTEKTHELTEEVAAAALERALGGRCRAEKGATFMMPQHPGLVVDAETRSLVEESKYLQFADDERSVLCTLTGKKIPPAYDNILLYMGSRKVQRLLVEGPFFMTVSTSNCINFRAYNTVTSHV